MWQETFLYTYYITKGSHLRNTLKLLRRTVWHIYIYVTSCAKQNVSIRPICVSEQSDQGLYGYIFTGYGRINEYTAKAQILRLGQILMSIQGLIETLTVQIEITFTKFSTVKLKKKTNKNNNKKKKKKKKKKKNMQNPVLYHLVRSTVKRVAKSSKCVIDSAIQT